MCKVSLYICSEKGSEVNHYSGCASQPEAVMNPPRTRRRDGRFRRRLVVESQLRNNFPLDSHYWINPLTQWEGERESALSRKTCLSDITVCSRDWDTVGSICFPPEQLTPSDVTLPTRTIYRIFTRRNCPRANRGYGALSHDLSFLLNVLLAALVLCMALPAFAGPYSGPADTGNAIDAAIPSASPLFTEWADTILPVGVGNVLCSSRKYLRSSETGFNCLGDPDRG